MFKQMPPVKPERLITIRFDISRINRGFCFGSLTFQNLYFLNKKKLNE